MDNTKSKKDIANFEFDENNHQNDYKLLSQKLKSISDTIYLLEKNFLDKNS